jgi:hypothetical protein
MRWALLPTETPGNPREELAPGTLNSILKQVGLRRNQGKAMRYAVWTGCERDGSPIHEVRTTMTANEAFPAEGGCDCRAVRYRMETRPLFVHCCHCRWCQRESGASFALNAMIEADRVTDLGQPPELVHTPSASGSGQLIARCPRCKVAVWSHYSGSGPVIKFVRVGTLDNPDLLPPDIHIFTASKQPWVVLPEGAPAVPEYYDREQHWPPESLARRQAILPLIEAYQAARRAGT